MARRVPAEISRGAQSRPAEVRGPQVRPAEVKGEAVRNLEAVNPGHTRTQGNYTRPVR